MVVNSFRITLICSSIASYLRCPEFKSWFTDWLPQTEAFCGVHQSMQANVLGTDNHFLPDPFTYKCNDSFCIFRFLNIFDRFYMFFVPGT
jgi:hypothetical protein